MSENRFLWISRIPIACHEFELKKILEKFGDVRIKRFLRNENLNNYALAEFHDSKSASRAYKSDQPIALRGTYLRMEFCNSSGEPGILSLKNYRISPNQRAITSSNFQSSESKTSSDYKSNSYSTHEDFKGLEISRIPAQRYSDEQIRNILESEFRKYGRIISINLVPSKIGPVKSAIVTYRRSSESQKAFQSTRNGEKVLFSTIVNVSLHPGFDKENERLSERHQTNGAKFSEYSVHKPPTISNNNSDVNPTRTLYISGLTTNNSTGPVTQDQLNKAFRKFGDIIDVRMLDKMCSAYIQFSEMKGSVRAMTAHTRDPLKLGGRPLQLSYVLSTPSTCLWLAELPQGLAKISESQLLERLSIWSPVEEVIMISRTESKAPSTGHLMKPIQQHVAAFVRMASELQATKLLNHLRSEASSGWPRLLPDDFKSSGAPTQLFPVDFATNRQISVVECHRAKSNVSIGATNGPSSSCKQILQDNGTNVIKKVVASEDSRWEAASKAPMPTNPIIRTASNSTEHAKIKQSDHVRHRPSLFSVSSSGRRSSSISASSSSSASKNTSPPTHFKSSSSALTSPLMNGHHYSYSTVNKPCLTVPVSPNYKRTYSEDTAITQHGFINLNSTNSSSTNSSVTASLQQSVKKLKHDLSSIKKESLVNKVPSSIHIQSQMTTTPSTELCQVSPPLTTVKLKNSVFILNHTSRSESANPHSGRREGEYESMYDKIKRRTHKDSSTKALRTDHSKNSRKYHYLQQNGCYKSKRHKLRKSEKKDKHKSRIHHFGPTKASTPRPNYRKVIKNESRLMSSSSNSRSPSRSSCLSSKISSRNLSANSSSNGSVTPLIRSSFAASLKNQKTYHQEKKHNKESGTSISSSMKVKSRNKHKSRKRGHKENGLYPSISTDEEDIFNCNNSHKRKKKSDVSFAKSKPFPSNVTLHHDISMANSFTTSMKEVHQKLVSNSFSGIRRFSPNGNDDVLNDSYDEFDRYSVSTPSTEPMEQELHSKLKLKNKASSISASSSSSRWGDESIDHKSEDEIWQSSDNAISEDKLSPKLDRVEPDDYSPMRSMLGVSIPCAVTGSSLGSFSHLHLKSPDGLTPPGPLSSTNSSLLGGKFNSSVSSHHDNSWASANVLMSSSVNEFQEIKKITTPNSSENLTDIIPKNENISKSPSVSSPSPAASIGALNNSKWCPGELSSISTYKSLVDSSHTSIEHSLEIKSKSSEENTDFETWKSKHILPPGVNVASALISPNIPGLLLPVVPVESLKIETPILPDMPQQQKQPEQSMLTPVIIPEPAVIKTNLITTPNSPFNSPPLITMEKLSPEMPLVTKTKPKPKSTIIKSNGLGSPPGRTSNNRWSKGIDSTDQGAIIGDIDNYVKKVIERVTAESVETISQSSGHSADRASKRNSSTINSANSRRGSTSSSTSQAPVTQTVLNSSTTNVLNITNSTPITAIVQSTITPVITTSTTITNNLEEVAKSEEKKPIVSKRCDPYEPNFDEESPPPKNAAPVINEEKFQVKIEQTKCEVVPKLEPKIVTLEDKASENLERVIEDVAAGKFDIQSYIDSWFAGPRTSTPIPISQSPVTSTITQQYQIPSQTAFTAPVLPQNNPLFTTNSLKDTNSILLKSHNQFDTVATSTTPGNFISAFVSALSSNPQTTSQHPIKPLMLQSDVSIPQSNVTVARPAISATTITLPASTAAMVLQASGVASPQQIMNQRAAIAAPANALDPEIVNILNVIAMQQNNSQQPSATVLTVPVSSDKNLEHLLNASRSNYVSTSNFRQPGSLTNSVNSNVLAKQIEILTQENPQIASALIQALSPTTSDQRWKELLFILQQLGSNQPSQQTCSNSVNNNPVTISVSPAQSPGLLGTGSKLSTAANSPPLIQQRGISPMNGPGQRPVTSIQSSQNYGNIIGSQKVSSIPTEGLFSDLPLVWQGRLSLKNSEARIKLQYVNGNTDLLHACMGLLVMGGGGTPQQSLISSGGPLRIVQRMRLEPTQLEGVHRKILQQGASCTCLAFPAGLDDLDLQNQTRILKNSFINYMQEKTAAGIINVCHPDNQQGLYVVHIFPPCEFSQKQLGTLSPEVYRQLETHDLAHLLFVVTTV